MGFVDGARTAGPEDLVACQAVLAKLHARGIKHGDINKHNFLVGKECVVMIDFETAKWCDTKEEPEAEYSRLKESLRDESRRGGVGDVFRA